MTRTKKQSAKTRENPWSQKKEKKQSQILAGFTSRSRARLYTTFKKFRDGRKARLQQLCDKLLGASRSFPAHIDIPSHEIAKATDERRLRDVKDEIELDNAEIYWTDGSQRRGFLGAGVFWQRHSGTGGAWYKLGSSTEGCSSDAELFAVAAALYRAKRSVQGNRSVRLVRIYTDARAVLDSLRLRSYPWIGPLHNNEIALQGLFETAEWLVAEGVRLELIWVKGHSGSEGNKSADKLATKAVSRQIAAGKKAMPRINKYHKTPDMWKPFGTAWATERLYRKYRSRNFENEQNTTREHKWLSAALESLEKLEASQSSQDGSASGADGGNGSGPSGPRGTERNNPPLTQLTPNQAPARRKQWMNALAIWGRQPVLCTTRLRKPSQLDKEV